MDINFFAETNFRNQNQRFGVKTDDRRKHFYIIGKTGMGKTTLLRNMAAQDIQNGNGVGIVDPHGEFADGLLDFVPKERINDVVYFNPADLDFPIAFNAIEKVSTEHRHLIASGLVGIFKKTWAESWGPRLEYVLRNAILALLEYPGSTLLGIMRILVDKEYRKKVIAQINDPVVKAFWTEEFTKYPDRFAAEAVAPIQNKVGQFLTNPLIRNIVGQTKSTIDIRKIMDEKKILIMNLSKGAIGEDSSNLLGAMMIIKLQLAAMSRVDIPEEERQDFFLYVDEFQNFATESFANILSEARKYRLDLTLAHQYITQMPEEVRDAVFGNVGTMLCFRVGAADAEFLEKEFEPEFMVQDLVNLGLGQIYLKLMIDGTASRPFSAATLPGFPPPAQSYRDKIIASCRERYATPRSVVEEKIARWSGPAEPVAKPGEGLYDAVCSICKAKIKLNFAPDPKRAIYCKTCLKDVQREKAKTEPRSDARPRTDWNNQGIRQNNMDTRPVIKPEIKTEVKPEVKAIAAIEPVQAAAQAVNEPQVQDKPREPKSETKIVNPGSKTISLSDLVKKQPVDFGAKNSRARERKPIDLEALDEAIKEAIEPEKKNEAKDSKSE